MTASYTSEGWSYTGLLWRDTLERHSLDSHSFERGKVEVSEVITNAFPQWPVFYIGLILNLYRHFV